MHMGNVRERELTQMNTGAEPSAFRAQVQA